MFLEKIEINVGIIQRFVLSPSLFAFVEDVTELVGDFVLSCNMLMIHY